MTRQCQRTKTRFLKIVFINDVDDTTVPSYENKVDDPTVSTYTNKEGFVGGR